MADTAFMPQPGALRRQGTKLAITGAQWAAKAVVKARAWRLHAALPGFAGAGLVSAGFGLRFGAWAGLLAAGLFLLRLDSRL